MEESLIASLLLNKDDSCKKIFLAFLIKFKLLAIILEI